MNPGGPGRTIDYKLVFEFCTNTVVRIIKAFQNAMQLNLYNLGAVVSDCDCYSEDPEFDHRLDRYLFKDNKFISGLG